MRFIFKQDIMYRIFLLIFATSYFIVQTAGRHTFDDKNQINDNRNSEKASTVKIDPVLRKALLRALEKLEKSEVFLSTTSEPLTATTVQTDTPKISTIASIDEAKVEDVQFFTAPLVAAFTVQQDFSGIPKAVIPIFKQSAKFGTISPVAEQNLRLDESKKLENELKRLQSEYRQTQFELQKTKELIERQRFQIEPHLERTIITSVQRLPTEFVLNFNGNSGPSRLQRHESEVGNFFQSSHTSLLNNSLEPPVLDEPEFNSIFSDSQQFVNQRLKRLLYFSGFESNHDDLNIVSKVLSLNHYRPTF